MSTNSADSSSGKSRTCVNFVKCPVVKDTNPRVDEHNMNYKLPNIISSKDHYSNIYSMLTTQMKILIYINWIVQNINDKNADPTDMHS